MADPVLYATQQDLEWNLSPSTVQALFDDNREGQVSSEAIIGVLVRARDWVDSFLARVYLGPFPVIQTPVPGSIKNCTVEFAIAFAFERHPEYVHTYGEAYRSITRFKRACEMAERLCNGMQEIPDWILQPKPRNIGGIITYSGPRTIVDNPDGSRNGGDF